MEQINKIVVPVDFQQHTDKLVEFAVYMASELTAEVSFFHVTEPLVNYIDFVPSSAEIVEKDMLAHAEEKMKQLIEGLKDKCSGCTGRVFSGDVVESIVGFAKDERASMIVIGTHGHKGIEKMMLGSVAERVVKNTPCPILVYNPYR